MTMALESAALAPRESPAPVERPPISVLGVRRRYWELTHGWTVPANPSDTPDIVVPGRVA